MKIRFSPVFVSLLFVFVVLACGKKENAGPVSDLRPTPQTKTMVSPDFTTDARALYSELRSNIEESGLDIKPETKQKYDGKNIRLSGKIKKNLEMLGSREITMEGDDNLGQVFLKFAPQVKSKSEILKPGEEITIQCIGVSWQIGPQLEKCVFIP